MVKSILMVSLLLFVPLFSSNAEIVIGSSESLTERNLPLLADTLNYLYSEDVERWNDCRGRKDIRTYFINDSIKVPFSAKELLKLCHKNTGVWKDPFNLSSCKSHCVGFVMDYVKKVSLREEEKNFDFIERDIPYDENNLKLAVKKFIKNFGHCDTPMAFGEDRLRAYINDYVIERGIKAFSSKELLRKCEGYYNQFYNPDFCMDRCSFFVEYYKESLEK